MRKDIFRRQCEEIIGEQMKSGKMTQEQGAFWFFAVLPQLETMPEVEKLPDRLKVNSALMKSLYTVQGQRLS